jgi:S-adenosylmethionine hydrolase
MNGGPIITLLTDFGTRDGYVAAMKGVVWSLAPGALVVDAAHDIAPQDVRAGAWVLRQYATLYPAGTVHVAVVDPGVGTTRRILAVRADERIYVAPDNGLLWWVLQSAHRVDSGAVRPGIHRPGPPSSTFHGRDVIAHAAGRLAAGASWDDLVEPFTPRSAPVWGRASRDGKRLRGEVIHVDRFGNLITNLTREDLGGSDAAVALVSVGDHRVAGLRTTFSEVAPGADLAYVGSDGHLEIGINQGSAASAWQVVTGTPVEVVQV